MTIRTDRLELRQFRVDDAEFILELLSEPEFRRFIGDKGVRSLDDACDYLQQGPIASYAEHGFGILCVNCAKSDDALGMCGLVWRPEFDDPDLGFAFLARHWSNGYAGEAARAVLEYARVELGLGRVIAMADDDNRASVRVLEKLGFDFETRVTMPGETSDVGRYAIEF